MHDKRNCIIALLNIGGEFLNKSSNDSAIIYFQLAENKAKLSDETLILSTIYRNLGAVYFKQKNYNTALKYFRNVPSTHIGIYDSNKWYLLANIFVEINNGDSARYYLNKVTDLQEMAPNYYRLWQILNENEGNLNKALYYSKRVTSSTDSLYKTKLDVSFSGMEKKYKFQSLQVSNQELIIKNKQNIILLYLALFILSLGAAIVLFRRNRIKSQQLKVQIQLVENERILVEKEKENINLLEQQLKMQNILLSNVEQYRKHSIKRPLNDEERRGVISPILNPTFHEELIASMDVKYNNISKRLIERFPDLTQRDILICCLLLADFDTGMIATILDLKIESITKHRYRLRAKLQMQNSENLVDYLNNL